MYEKKTKVIPYEQKKLDLGENVNAIAETCLQPNVPWCLRDSVSEVNVPGFNLQNVPDLVCNSFTEWMILE